MIDIHTHIIPNLDDGPEKMAESLAIARTAFDAGTRTLVATPHVLNCLDMNRNMLIIDKYEELKELVKAEIPELTLLLGSEIYCRPGLADLVRFEVATINNNGRYLLLEFSLTDLPKGFERELKNLQKNGIIPIVAHPERNLLALKRPSLIGRMVGAGALIQINSGSLCGSFGRQIKKLAYNLLKRRWVHVIASDVHGLNHRGPDLREAVSIAEKAIGAAEASHLVRENPRIITEGLPWPGRKIVEVIPGGTR